MKTDKSGARDSLAALLRGFSAEVTSGDRKSIEAATAFLPPRTEVYVASLPSDDEQRTVSVARELSRAGLTPVPHLVARNIQSLKAFDLLLQRLTGEAGVDTALVLGGDRHHCAGEFESSLQLIETGMLDKHGILNIALAWYPEGHPRIAASDLTMARTAKLQRALRRGLRVKLVSQFCFEAAPIIESAKLLRAESVTAPLRIGIAGPATRTSLLKYAMICGVGASVRALQERPGTRALLQGETPENLLRALAEAQSQDPTLQIEGIHFFTFASLLATVKIVVRCAPAFAIA